MNEALERPPKNLDHSVLKFIILIIFFISAICLFKFTSIRNYVTPETLEQFLENAGIWAPIVYMLFYALGVCFFLPGTMLTGLGAVIFGPYRGFLYVWVGAMIGASAAFFIPKIVKKMKGEIS